MTPLSSTEILARTLWGEARGEGEPGMHAVANVVMNRAHHARWWGRDVWSVCRAWEQFSCWNPDDPNLPKLRAVTTADKQYLMALNLASQAVAGKLPDITKGALYYKETALPWPVAWGQEIPPLVVIGKQSFYGELKPLKAAA